MSSIVFTGRNSGQRKGLYRLKRNEFGLLHIERHARTRRHCRYFRIGGPREAQICRYHFFRALRFCKTLPPAESRSSNAE